jgi:hypothetical protein
MEPRGFVESVSVDTEHFFRWAQVLRALAPQGGRIFKVRPGEKGCQSIFRLPRPPSRNPLHPCTFRPWP